MDILDRSRRVGLLSHQHQDYQQSIDILTSQGKFYINLGLERVQKVLNLIGNPQKDLKFIHVAGTNGKGSVCAMLASIIAFGEKSEVLGKRKEEKGKGEDNAFYLLPFTFYPNNSTLRVGLFISPHVFEYTERIKINDKEIDKETFAKGVNEITKLADKNGIHLTEFEILTVVAFKYFKENNVDIVILETGLGGRLDATNIIKNPICSIITNISLDHTERLGDTIEKIAFEKAGIIKQNCPVVISESNLGFEVIKKIAQEKNAQVFMVCTPSPLAGEDSAEQNDLVSFCERFRHEERVPEKLGEGYVLKGIYQQENLALVLKTVDLLNQNGFNITQEMVENGLKKVKHPCRFEYLKEFKIIIDGAHNPDGTKVLRESLDFYFPNQKIKFVFGCLRNKDYAQMMKNLFRLNDEVYFYKFDNENSCSYEELASVCEFNSKSFNEFKQDLNVLTVICGSFYMIKELLTKMGIK